MGMGMVPNSWVPMWKLYPLPWCLRWWCCNYAMALVLQHFLVCLVRSTIFLILSCTLLTWMYIIFPSAPIPWLLLSHGHVTRHIHKIVLTHVLSSSFTHHHSRKPHIVVPTCHIIEAFHLTKDLCKSVECARYTLLWFLRSGPHHLFVYCAGKLCIPAVNDSEGEDFIHIQTLFSLICLVVPAKFKLCVQW